MQLLITANQINEQLEKIFEFSASLFQDDAEFISSKISDEKLKQMVLNTKDLNIRKQGIDDLCGLVFQLKNPLFALANMTKMMLISKNFDAIFNFVCRLFVSHIGQTNYLSQTPNITIIERYFDRFVEIIKNCDISPEMFMPLILDIFRSDKVGGIVAWRRPSIEFLQSFWDKNQQWTIDYLSKNNELKYQLLLAITEFNTLKGINLLVQDFLNGGDQENILHVLKNYKRETLMVIDKELMTADDQTRLKLIELMCLFDTDTEVLTRLQEIYLKEVSEDIKSLIASKVGVTKVLPFKTEKQFQYIAKRKVKEPQERSLGIAFQNLPLFFESGIEATSVDKTMLITLFKDEKQLVNLSKLKILNTIFNVESFSNFAFKLFDTLTKKDDIKEAKWCLRLASVACGGKHMQTILDFAILLFQCNRAKEGKYLLLCLTHCARDEVLDIFRRLSDIKMQEFLNNKKSFVELFSQSASISRDLVFDKIASENFDDKIIKEETERLYWTFIGGRMYLPEEFNQIFLAKRLFNYLGQKLVFGEYIFGRLHSAFILEGKEKKYLYGNAIINENLQISIIHTLDLSFRQEFLKDVIAKPLFEQFPESRFNVNDFSRSSISVARFDGMFVNLPEFTKKMISYGFEINKRDDQAEFESFVHDFKGGNLIAELSLKHSATINTKTATLGAVYFVRECDVLNDNGEFIILKTNAISVGALPYRYFDFVLSAIYNACIAGIN